MIGQIGSVGILASVEDAVESIPVVGIVAEDLPCLTAHISGEGGDVDGRRHGLRAKVEGELRVAQGGHPVGDVVHMVAIVTAVSGRTSDGVNATRIGTAGGVGTIDEAVSVVVQAVVADLGSGDQTSWIPRAVHDVGAVHESIAVVVDAVGTVLSARSAEGAAKAIGIRAVDPAIGVVVDAVVANGLGDSAGASGITGTGGIKAVDQTVAVVVHAIVADLWAGAGRIAKAGRVKAVDEAVAVVVEAVGTDLYANADRGPCTNGVDAAIHILAVLVAVLFVILAIVAAKLLTSLVALGSGAIPSAWVMSSPSTG